MRLGKMKLGNKKRLTQMHKVIIDRVIKDLNIGL